MLVVISLESEFVLEVIDVAYKFIGGGAFVVSVLVAGHGVVVGFGIGFDEWWRMDVLDIYGMIKSHCRHIEVWVGRCICCHCGE